MGSTTACTVPADSKHSSACKPRWGSMVRIVEKIQAARDSGLDIRANQYPYVAGGTALASSLPPWVADGGASKLLVNGAITSNVPNIANGETSSGQGGNGHGHADRVRVALGSIFMGITCSVCGSDKIIRAGACGVCNAPHSAGAVFCWQCGNPLLVQVSSEAYSR